MLKFFSKETNKWVHVPVKISEEQMDFLIKLIEKLEEDKADKVTVGEIQQTLKGKASQEQLDKVAEEMGDKLDSEDLLDINNKFDSLKKETAKIKELEVSVEELQVSNEEFSKKFVSIQATLDGVDENLNKLGKEIQVVTEDLAEHYHEQYVENTVFEESIDSLQKAIEKLEGGVVSGGVTEEEMFEALQIMQREIDLEMDELKKSVSSGKEKVADSITQKGVVTAPWETFQVMADNILKIEGEGTGGEDGKITIRPMQLPGFKFIENASLNMTIVSVDKDLKFEPEFITTVPQLTILQREYDFTQEEV